MDLSDRALRRAASFGGHWRAAERDLRKAITLAENANETALLSDLNNILAEMTAFHEGPLTTMAGYLDDRFEKPSGVFAGRSGGTGEGKDDDEPGEGG